MHLPYLGERPDAGEDIMFVMGFRKIALFLLVQLVESAPELGFTDRSLQHPP